MAKYTAPILNTGSNQTLIYKMLIANKQVSCGIISSLHAVWMMLLTFGLLNWHFVHWDEGEVLQFGPILKKYVLGWETKPAKDELMFINVCHDNQLVEINDQWGFPIGNETVTDRSKLADLLATLAKNDNHKGIICDIRFDLKSPDDTVLQNSFDALQRYVVSNHIVDLKPNKPVLKVTTGISDYSFSGGSFFKFRYIYNDSIKSVPLVLNEITDNKHYQLKKRFLYDGKTSYFNVFMVDLLVRPFDIFEDEKPYFYDNLGNLLFLDPVDLAKITKDKIIVIGDFEKHDRHETLLGKMPGPMILLNAYLNLNRGYNHLTLPFVAVLFTYYFLISLYLFIPNDVVERKIHKIVRSTQVAHFITDVFGYFLMLLVLLFISYFLFGILLNLLWLVVYLVGTDKILNLISKYRAREKSDNL